MLDPFHVKLDKNTREKIHEQDGSLLSKSEIAYIQAFMEQYPSYVGPIRKKNPKNPNVDSPSILNFDVYITRSVDPGSGDIVQRAFAVYFEDKKHRLGKGAYGSVVLGQDINTQDWVAIKKQSPDPDNQALQDEVQTENITLNAMGELVGAVSIPSVVEVPKKVQNPEEGEAPPQANPTVGARAAFKRGTQEISVMTLAEGTNPSLLLFDEYGLKKSDYVLDKEDSYGTPLDLENKDHLERFLYSVEMALEVNKEVENEHLAGYVNRDIKMPNFMWHEDKMRAKIVDRGMNITIEQAKQKQDKAKELVNEMSELRDQLTKLYVGKSPNEELTEEDQIKLQAVNDSGQVIEDFIIAEVKQEDIPENQQSLIAQINDTYADYMQLGLVKGTPPYMSPEIWLQEGASIESDNYALGVVLLEVFGGLDSRHYDMDTGMQSIYQGNADVGIEEIMNCSSPAYWAPILWKYDEVYEKITELLKKHPGDRPQLGDIASVLASNRVKLYQELGQDFKAELARCAQKIREVEVALKRDDKDITQGVQALEQRLYIQKLSTLYQEINLLLSQDPISKRQLDNVFTESKTIFDAIDANQTNAKLDETLRQNFLDITTAFELYSLTNKEQIKDSIAELVAIFEDNNQLEPLKNMAKQWFDNSFQYVLNQKEGLNTLAQWSTEQGVSDTFTNKALSTLKQGIKKQSEFLTGFETIGNIIADSESHPVLKELTKEKLLEKLESLDNEAFLNLSEFQQQHLKDLSNSPDSDISSLAYSKHLACVSAKTVEMVSKAADEAALKVKEASLSVTLLLMSDSECNIFNLNHIGEILENEKFSDDLRTKAQAKLDTYFNAIDSNIEGLNQLGTLRNKSYANAHIGQVLQNRIEFILEEKYNQKGIKLLVEWSNNPQASEFIKSCIQSVIEKQIKAVANSENAFEIFVDHLKDKTLSIEAKDYLCERVIEKLDSLTREDILNIPETELKAIENLQKMGNNELERRALSVVMDYYVIVTAHSVSSTADRVSKNISKIADETAQRVKQISDEVSNTVMQATLSIQKANEDLTTDENIQPNKKKETGKAEEFDDVGQPKSDKKFNR